jgi:transglutaminase-like putative cysteine protease
VEINVHHQTTFQYAGPVRDSVNEVRLCPLTDALQTTLNFRLTTEPVSDPRPYTDYFGNTVYTFDIPEPHTRLAVTVSSHVITRSNPAAAAVMFTDRYQPLALEAAGDLIDFLQPTARADFSPGIVALARELRAAESSDLLGALVMRVCHTLHERFEYVPGATDVGTTAGDALAALRGVCQDYTHVMLAVLRVLGVATRYTSGYLHHDGDPDTLGEQASHAWVEVWFPTGQWIGVDPTNDRIVDENYVRVAYGRDYGDVSPLRGSYRGAETAAMDVDVWVSEGAPAMMQQQQQSQQ